MAAGFGPIPGIKVGHAQDTSTAFPSASLRAGGTGAQDEHALTGCTVLLFDPASAPKGAEAGMVAACDVRGGAVGERELETLRPGHLVERIHALVFAGGSAFGLDAASGVMRWCEEHGIGFDAGVARVPIVPAAILFDLGIGDPSRRPDAAMGYAAAQAAAASSMGAPVAEGNVGAGTGATVGKLFGLERATKAGIGCWTEELLPSAAAPERARVAALAAVNAFGDIRDPDTNQIIAGARTEQGPAKFVDTAAAMRHGSVRAGFADPFAGNPNTVLVAVATNATLSRLEAQRLAVMASAGLTRVVSPAHTTFDGDVIFALSIGNVRADINALGAAAAEAVARAIVRGVTQAHTAGGVRDFRS